MSLLSSHNAGPSLCASSQGWAAVRMWSGMIAPCEVSQITSFPIVSRYLGDLFEEAGAEAALADGIRTGTPLAIARIVWQLDGTDISRRAGELVNDAVERRLVSEAVRLRRLVEGTLHRQDGMAGFYRPRVIDTLTQEFMPESDGFDEKDRKSNASIRASLAANEVLPFAERYFQDLEKNPRPTRMDRKTMVRQVRVDLSRLNLRTPLSDLIAAFEAYLEAAGLAEDLR